MRQAVREAFWDFSIPMEGYVDHLYQDVKGLVTVGVGNLVDPVAYALPLPFVDRVTGKRASNAEITAEWMRVKNDASLARLGHRAAAHVTRLKLHEADIRRLVANKLDQMWAHYTARFPDAETFCADAQLGLASMCWALGPGFSWPMFHTAQRARNFQLMAAECSMSEKGNPGVAPRNVRNRLLFQNAHRVEEDGLNPEQLYFPRALVGRTWDPEAVTQPEIPNPPSVPRGTFDVEAHVEDVKKDITKRHGG